MNLVHLPSLELCDAHWHRTWAELESGLQALPPAPRDNGSVTAIIRRPAPQQRESLESVDLSVTEGIPGDAWNHAPSKSPEGQLAVMNTAIARLLANGQALGVFGDNLFVDLNLSTESLPIGSRLAVGNAVVEVTPLPHNGCRKFHARFGPDALRLVQDPKTRAQNFRGIYWKVVTPGRVQVGAPVQVLSRPHPGAQNV